MLNEGGSNRAVFGEGIRAVEPAKISLMETQFGGSGVRSESPNSQHGSDHGQNFLGRNIGFGGMNDVNNFQSGAQLTTLPSMQPLQFSTQSGLHQQARQGAFGTAGLFPEFESFIAPSTGRVRGGEGLQAYSAPRPFNTYGDACGLRSQPRMPLGYQRQQVHQGGFGTASSLPEFESFIAPSTGRLRGGEGLQAYPAPGPFNPYGDASSLRPRPRLPPGYQHQQAHQGGFGTAGSFPEFESFIAPSTGRVRGGEGLQAYSAPRPFNTYGDACGLRSQPRMPLGYQRQQVHQGGFVTASSSPEFESFIAPLAGRLRVEEDAIRYSPFIPNPPLPPAPPPQLRPVALQARAEARARAEAWGYAHAQVGPQAVARMEALAQALGAGVWPVKAHTFTYPDVLADSKVKDIIYSIEPDHRHTLAHHLYHSHATQEYWWLIQIITPITRLPPELLHQILLFIIDEASDSPLALMRVCKHWYDIVTRIWASLRLGTTTPKDAVTTKLERNQWFLDVVVDTEIDRGHSTPSEGAYQAIFAAIEATDRWRSFVVETFLPQADLPEHLVNSRLQRCSGAVMNRIRTFKINSACEMSPLLDHLLRILGKSASRELTTVKINSPSVILFLVPTYSTIFHSVKVLSLDTPGLRNPVDLLPHLHQLESLTASHISFPTYSNDVDLPFVHTLRHLSLKAVSIQWMSGRTFRALESCTFLLPLHRHILHTFSTTLPNCKSLTFQGYPLDILNGVSARELNHLSVTCSSSFKPRGNRELVQFSSQALRQSRLSPRILHLSIEATSEAWIVALAFMSDLEELVIENARPSSLGAKVLRSLVVQPVYANNLGTTATPGCPNTPVCPSLRRFGLRYRRGLRPSEPFDLIPEFMSIILSRQRSKFPLQSFQIWISSDQKDPLELIDGPWISLEGFERLMNAIAINMLQVMASKVVESMVKPSGKSSTACPQRLLASSLLLSLPRTPPPVTPPPPPLLPNLPTPRVPPSLPPHLLDLLSSMPDPVSSRSLTVLVRRPYENQRFNEINLIEGEYIYDVEQLDDGWWRGTTADGKRGLFPAGHVVESAVPNEAKVPPRLLSVRPAPKNRTPTMFALRSYQAEEYNEVNLIEGEYVYCVEQFDDKWWIGTTPDGKRGFFPANYVIGFAIPGAEVLTPLFPVR